MNDANTSWDLEYIWETPSSVKPHCRADDGGQPSITFGVKFTRDAAQRHAHQSGRRGAQTTCADAIPLWGANFPNQSLSRAS